MPTSTQSIREIVSNQSSAAAVLQRFEIDLCSQANESLKQACTELQLSVDQVLEKLSDAAGKENGAVPADLAGYSLSRLIQHIVRVHHQYVRSELPRVAAMAHKLAAKHGDRSPELKRVEALLDALHAEMFAHLQKEEQVLFPFIAQMEEEAAGFTSPVRACFKTVAQPVSMMVREHESAEGLVAEMRRLTNGFKAPAWGCVTYVALFAELSQFERDLRQHVHIENDILFPRAVEMESTLNERR
ncbi:MAG TPA: iron-sulfur cluster repair di-iron protein [Terracidiphilus sp.]|nr:iron-sulfur cluster repair di-iron protein [Terracidiphilus sp.]